MTIRCLPRDKDLVRDLIPGCVEEFKAFVKKELEIDWPLQVDLDDRTFLQLRRIEEISELHAGRGVAKSDEDKKW